MFQQKNKRLNHKEVCEKYQMQVATTPRLMRKMQELPPRPPPPERAFVYRLPSPAPPVSPDAWKMSLTQYRKPARYSEQVPSYEQSMLAVSRRIRNKSQPPPLPLTSSYAALRRSCSRPRTPSSGLPPFQSNYSTHNAYTKIFDHKRTPARGL